MQFTQLPPLCCEKGSVDGVVLGPKSSCRTRSGIQKALNLLDSGFRRNDVKQNRFNSCESINMVANEFLNQHFVNG